MKCDRRHWQVHSRTLLWSAASKSKWERPHLVSLSPRPLFLASSWTSGRLVCVQGTESTTAQEHVVHSFVWPPSGQEQLQTGAILVNRTCYSSWSTREVVKWWSEELMAQVTDTHTQRLVALVTTLQGRTLKVQLKSANFIYNQVKKSNENLSVNVKSNERKNLKIW